MPESAAPMSMTGFARAEGEALGHRWVWEIRSVNGKGLEVRFRLPPGFGEIEAPARRRFAAAPGRGNVQASPNLSLAEGGGRLKVNEPLLRDVLAIIRRVQGE